jgi:hypothetical protein
MGRHLSRRYVLYVDLTDARCWYWPECSIHVHHHGVAIRCQDGLLYDWMVAEPKVLLFGDLGRGDWVCRMDELGRCRAVQVDGIHLVCGKSEPR